jgi:hypothetical protein
MCGYRNQILPITLAMCVTASTHASDSAAVTAPEAHSDVGLRTPPQLPSQHLAAAPDTISRGTPFSGLVQLQNMERMLEWARIVVQASAANDI